MTALRLARACTGRNKILKFDGCYHGHGDQLLVAAGSGLLTHGVASSSGVPDAVAADTLVVAYNDLGGVERVVDECGDDLAAIIVEPIACNMGLVMPAPGFLDGLRKAADRSGAMLIFDEVITGFRLGPTSYGAMCGVTPDLTCLGKIIGGGLPIGAVAGPRDVMQHLAPVGDVYQAGTLSGNPVAVAAGLTTLRILIAENPYPRLAALGDRLRKGLNDAGGEERGGRRWRCAGIGSMFTVFFTSASVVDKTTAMQSDTDGYARFFHAMLERGFYLPPSQFEVGFVSVAHSEADIAGFLAGGGASTVLAAVERKF